MTTYKTLEEVKKDYPNLDVNKFSYFQENYLLNNKIKTIDKDCNINCINCIGCKDCMDCEDCTNCTDCIGCKDCMDCEDCRYCRDCKYCGDCNYCKYYINNKPNQN